MLDWVKFWKDFDDDPDEIKDVEGLIFQDKTGVWKMAILPPNTVEGIVVQVDFNPWTGERLNDD